ncbi:TetR/AcrR family transcriptional regulator [Antrihabitans sp. YC3-6]|uniref:TetR/AcrR family transcriptional regulator n=1 Tax=Antrihabitans stalagmiti TaxID=2799499 RepID=A0A934U0J3_9NOCA|nr:TetR/AcrR family transcriptional regulator [Antrihabitans stalagmiti]MBJ8337680.1 TetR/AcrR family transcriptional regulator [Antrihabitans stalagmiti]
MRTRLLDATIECLVEYGYVGTTTPRVAEKAGVTRGAQVHHFGSKTDLVVAAIRHLAAKRTDAVIRDIGSVQANPDPLGAMFDLLWDIHSGPIFIATVELWVAGRTDPQLGREVAKFEPVVVNSMMTLLAEAMPAPVLKPMRDFLYTAMDALRGILISSYVDADPDRARRRWDRASANLRRIAAPELESWAGNRAR